MLQLNSIPCGGEVITSKLRGKTSKVKRYLLLQRSIRRYIESLMKISPANAPQVNTTQVSSDWPMPNMPAAAAWQVEHNCEGLRHTDHQRSIKWCRTAVLPAPRASAAHPLLFSKSCNDRHVHQDPSCFRARDIRTRPVVIYDGSPRHLQKQQSYDPRRPTRFLQLLIPLT